MIFFYTLVSHGVYYIYHALVPAHVVSQFYHEMVISFHTLAHSIYMRCLKILYCTHRYFTQFLIILFFHTLHFISHNLATMYWYLWYHNNYLLWTAFHTLVSHTIYTMHWDLWYLTFIMNWEYHSIHKVSHTVFFVNWQFHSTHWYLTQCSTHSLQ